MPKSKHGKRNKKSGKRARSENDLDKDAKRENDSKKLKVEKKEPAENREAVELVVPPTIPDAPPPSDAESKWENLVYYYLARLKGLCEWRTEAEVADAATIGKAANAFNNIHVDKLEERVLKNVAKESYPQPDKHWAKNKELHNRRSRNEVDTYMLAGYQEGKEQGVKIIARALKYGVMAGILKQDGEKYRVNEKYLKNTPPSASSSGSGSTGRTITSIESGASVDTPDGKRRNGKGSKMDKFQTVPNLANPRDQRSCDEFNFKNKASHSSDLNKSWPGQGLKLNLKNSPTSSHRGTLGSKNPEVQRLPKNRAEHSKDLYRSQSGASKDITAMKPTHDERKSLSTVKVQQKMHPKKVRVPTRNSTRPRKISSKEYNPTTYKSKRSRDAYQPRSQSRNQRRKRYRSRSTSDSD